MFDWEISLEKAGGNFGVNESRKVQWYNFNPKRHIPSVSSVVRAMAPEMGREAKLMRASRNKTGEHALAQRYLFHA
jgi:hypothetical protein